MQFCFIKCSVFVNITEHFKNTQTARVTTRTSSVAYHMFQRPRATPPCSCLFNYLYACRGFMPFHSIVWSKGATTHSAYVLLISGNLDTAIMSCLQEFDGTQFFMTLRRVTFPHAKLDSRGFTLSWQQVGKSSAWPVPHGKWVYSAPTATLEQLLGFYRSARPEASCKGCSW